MQKYKLGKHEVRVCGKAVETDAGIELVHSGSFIEFYGEIGKVSMKISGNADESDFAAYVGVFLNEVIHRKQYGKYKMGCIITKSVGHRRRKIQS